MTIRLLDPPLHEFLPQEGPAMDALCRQLAQVGGGGSGRGLWVKVCHT